jgi:2-methylisocitrate lyase-like PEP mutase family enzyme
MGRSRARRFRELLDGPGMTFRPCAYDALSVILIERAGFEVMVTTDLEKMVEDELGGTDRVWKERQDSERA